MNVKANKTKKQANVENGGSETHYIRAIDIRGRELSRKAFEFSDMAEGFEAAKA